MRRLSVHYPCHPLSTHDQKSVSLGSPFFLVDREHLLGLMWLLSSLEPQEMLEPSEAAMAAIGGIAGGN